MATIHTYRAMTPTQETLSIAENLDYGNVKEHEKNGDFFISDFKALYLYTLEEKGEEMTGLVCLLDAAEIPELADASLSGTDFKKAGLQLDLIPVSYPHQKHLPELLAWHVSRKYAPRLQFTRNGVTHTIRALQSNLDTEDIIRSTVVFKNLKVIGDNGDAAAIAAASASGRFAAVLMSDREVDKAARFAHGLLNFRLEEE